MTSLTEKANYAYGRDDPVIPIKENDSVSIIHKNFTKLNLPINMKTISIDDSKFIKGTFISDELISEQGYGGNYKYTVKLDDIDDFKRKVPDQADKHFQLEDNILTFYVSPQQFYFKEVVPPKKRSGLASFINFFNRKDHIGGKINLKKTKKIKQKKNKTNKTKQKIIKSKQKIIKSKKNKNKIQKNH